MIPTEKLMQIVTRSEYLEAKMVQGNMSAEDYTAVSKEYAVLEPLVAQVKEYQNILASLDSARQMLSDPEMREMAEDEVFQLEKALPDAEHAVRLALLPKDAADERSAIMEIRAGTGGDEAALFAGDLLRMYLRYAENCGWKTEILDQSESEVGGYKDISLNIKGQGVFAKLKFESGVHRVQRVPQTESGGRIHTSAATVAVLPEAQEVDIEIKQEDIRIDTMRASGAGGQHVNTTDSAVRITHIPSGIVVTSSEKSQHQNRARAMEVLRTKLYDLKRQETDSARAAERKGQIGSGDRSERIRTYNYPQGRMTDHRINLTLYKLDSILAGDINEIVDALVSADQAEMLSAMDQ